MRAITLIYENTQFTNKNAKRRDEWNQSATHTHTHTHVTSRYQQNVSVLKYCYVVSCSVL